MSIVKKFSELDLEELKEGIWVTTKECIFHRYHPMLVSLEDGCVKFECSEDDYFTVKGDKIEEVQSTTTAYLARKVEVSEVEEYLRKTKIFKLNDLIDLFSRLIQQSIQETPTPYNITLEECKLDGYYINISIKIEYNGIELSSVFSYNLGWNSKGCIIHFDYDSPYKYVSITSRELERKLHKNLRHLIFKVIDRFVCHYDHIQITSSNRHFIKKINDKFGLKFNELYENEFKYDFTGGYVRVDFYIIGGGTIRIYTEDSNKIREIIERVCESLSGVIGDENQGDS